MKNIISRISLALISTVAMTGCIEMMTNVKDVQVVEPVTVSYKVNAATGFIPKGGKVEADPNFSTKGVNVTFTNVKTGQVFSAVTGDDCVASADIDPGVYSISISGTAVHNGSKYYINGNIPQISLFKTVTPAEAAANDEYNLTVRPAKVGSLVFSEIYYCGIESYYFRDQTYQFYNNGDEVLYLDGICFAQLHPNVATTNLPVWPDEDGTDNYVYGMMVWQFPGSGHDYPLKPGESVTVVQEARDHRVNNPKSYDNSSAEWETSVGNESRANPDVDDLPNIFYTTWNKMQWLTSVFGAAFCIYKPDGAIIDASYYAKEDGNPHIQNEVNKTPKYAKIDADSILDGVELIPNMSSLNMKRIPGFVDAGATSVGATYIGKTVSRKVIDKRADGTPIYQDTNNSTDDFQINDSPAIRRNGEKAPSWSKSAK